MNAGLCGASVSKYLLYEDVSRAQSNSQQGEHLHIFCAYEVFDRGSEGKRLNCLKHVNDYAYQLRLWYAYDYQNNILMLLL